MANLRINAIGRTLAIATFRSVVLRFGGMALTLLMGIILARMLGPEDLGVYGSVMAVAAILAVPAQFGLPQLITREISSSCLNDDVVRIRIVLKWFALLVLAGSVVMMIIAALFWLPGSHVSDDLGVRVWGIALIPVTAAIALGMGTLRGFHRVVGAQLYDAVARPGLMLLALLVVFALDLRADAEFALAMQAGTGALVVALCALHVYRVLPSALKKSSSGPFDRRLIASALPMAGTETLRVLDGQYAIVLLSLLAPVDNVGLFRVALSLAGFVALPSTLVNLVTMSYIAELHRAGKSQLMVVDDKLGTPTYTHDFARNVALLLEKEYWGIYNMVCGGITGRLEVAQELVRLLGRDKDINVTPVSSDFFAHEYFAARPPSERLITKKLDLRGLNIMRDWRVCLEEYLEEYYHHYL